MPGLGDERRGRESGDSLFHPPQFRHPERGRPEGLEFCFGSSQLSRSGSPRLPEGSGDKSDRGPRPLLFFDQRQSGHLAGQRDVVDLVLKGEYDAGAVSSTALEKMEEDGFIAKGGVRGMQVILAWHKRRVGDSRKGGPRRKSNLEPVSLIVLCLASG